MTTKTHVLTGKSERQEFITTIMRTLGSEEMIVTTDHTYHQMLNMLDRMISVAIVRYTDDGTTRQKLNNLPMLHESHGVLSILTMMAGAIVHTDLLDEDKNPMPDQHVHLLPDDEFAAKIAVTVYTSVNALATFKQSAAYRHTTSETKIMFDYWFPRCQDWSDMLINTF